MHGPKPLIEEHYHIRELIDRQVERVRDREFHRLREKDLEERDSIIKDAKIVDRREFHCRRCKKDFVGVARLHIEEDWNGLNQRIAFYKTKCFCGTWCMRFVTDKERDPYWRLSPLVRADRANHANDLLQSFEEGFNLLYGKK